MYIEDSTLNSFVLADGEKIQKGCSEENKRFVIFTNKRILSGYWGDGLPDFTSIPYSAIIRWNTRCEENSTRIELCLPDECYYRYFFEATLGGEIDSILSSNTSK